MSRWGAKYPSLTIDIVLAIVLLGFLHQQDALLQVQVQRDALEAALEDCQETSSALSARLQELEAELVAVEGDARDARDAVRVKQV